MLKLSSAYAKLSPWLWEMAFFFLLTYIAALIAPEHLPSETVMIVMLTMVITIRLAIVISSWFLKRTVTFVDGLFSKVASPAQQPIAKP